MDNSLTLKLFSISDAPRLFSLVQKNNLRLRKWLTWVDETQTIEDSAIFIESTLRNWQEKKELTAAICCNDNLVGVIGFHDHVFADNRISIGYWIDAGFEGLGLMKRSCLAFMHFAYTALNINRIEISPAIGNEQSLRIVQRLGFIYEGTRQQGQRLYDRHVDQAIYRLLKKEWVEKIKENPQLIQNLPPLII